MKFLTEQDRLKSIADRSKQIVETFGEKFNKIRREGENPLNEADRIDMAEFFGDATNNVDTLFKMFSKYQPNHSWIMNIGYVNNANLAVPITPSNELEDIARKLGSPKFTSMVDSEEWQSAKMAQDDPKAKPMQKKYSNPYAPRTKTHKVLGPDGQQQIDPETGKKLTKKEIIPSKVYSTKSFKIQWGNIKQKSDRDADVKGVYDKYGLPWGDKDGGAAINPNDNRGKGWERLPGLPFEKHENTKNVRLAMYAKKEGIKHGKVKYFLNFEGDIAELTPEELNYLYSLSPKSDSSKMPKRLLDMENQEAAKEIFDMENSYDIKGLDLSKITYINCSMEINGENKKFSYINKNAVPSGLNPGDFAQFIDPS